MKIAPMKTHDPYAVDDFTRAYIECALWSENDESTPAGGVPFDQNYSIEDIAPETIGAMIADCQRFQVEQSALLKTAYAPRWAEDSTGKEYRKEDYTPSQAGHDFWLSRNGHGAGFFDRGLGEAGEALQAACGWRTSYPEIDLYIGDDGKIHA